MQANYYVILYKQALVDNWEKTGKVVKAENIEAVKNYLNRKGILNITEIQEFANPDFEGSDTIGVLRNTQPKYSGHAYIEPHTGKSRHIMRKEDLDENAQKVIELIQSALKLSPADKIVFINRTPEGYGAGKLAAESGSVLTSTDKYVYYWLEYSKEKGHYLNPLDIKKVETIK